jgi:hypothetical protein
MSAEITEKWNALLKQLEEQFGKKPNMDLILLLIGIRELGTVKTKFTKEEKVDLMHIAVCKLLSQSGYYELEGVDQDGWPHWKLIKKPPFVSLFEQEIFLRHYIVEYFESI